MNRSRSLTLALVLVLMCLAPQAATAVSSEYGSLDADFGSGGTVGDVKVAKPTALVIQQDRKILIAGGSPSAPYAGVIARVNRDGTPDKSFGIDGFVSTPGGGPVYDMKLLGDQRIATVREGNRVMVFNPDGKLDTGFGTGGVLDFGTSETSFKVASIGSQTGSKLLISGSPGQLIAAQLLRVDRQGDIDPTFGESGVVTLPMAGTGGPGASAIASTPQGDILLGLGSTRVVNGGASGLVVVKFTASGQRVLGFGSGGVASDPSLKDVPPKQIVVARDGTFVALNKTLHASAGKEGSLITYDWAFYNSDGELKLGYPGRWAVFGATPVDGPGFATSFSRQVSLFRPDLTLDPQFGLNGSNRVTVGPCSSWDQLATDVDGSIVAAGSSSSCQFHPGLTQLARFLGPNGGRAAPQVNIIGLSWSKKFHGKSIHRSWPRVLTGEALPGQGLKRVGIAIRRTDEPLPRKGLCGWLINNGKQYSRSKNCSKPIFMTAKGRSSWRFDLARPLAPGKYRLYARAYTKDGRFNPINDDVATFRYFTVKPAAKRE